MNSLQLHQLFARLMHFNFLLLLTQFLYGPHFFLNMLLGLFLSSLDVTCSNWILSCSRGFSAR